MATQRGSYYEPGRTYTQAELDALEYNPLNF